MKQKLLKTIRLRIALLVALLCSFGTGNVWADTYEQLTSIANIDESAEYVLGIDGTGFHYEGTSSWGKTALPSAQTPYKYTLKKAQDGKSFTAETTISGTKYYLQIPTSNTFSMETSTGTNTDIIIGTTQVSGTNYAVANKTTTNRHLRINSTSGLRSYAGTTGTMAFFYKVVPAAPAYTITAQSNNNTYGTVSLSGSVITGSPQSGCRYASPAYTVSSGTATVVQSDNAFTVTPSSDCTVTINFEAIPTHTVSSAVTPVGAGTVTFDATSVMEGSTTTATAEANEGYKFTGWSISGTGATLSSNSDNPTTVTMGTAEATVTANFAAVVTHKVKWIVNGQITTDNVEEGAAITFPDNPADVNGKKFVGWYTAEYTHATDAPVYVSSSKMGNADITYYAVFAEVSGSAGWVEAALTSMTSSDIFVIVGDNGSKYAMSNNNGASNAPSATAVTVTDGKITTSVTDVIKWNVTGNAEDGYTFYPNGSTTTWLYCTATNNGVRVGTNDNKLFKLDESGYLMNSATSRYVGIYNSQDWRCYTVNTGNIVNQTFEFYKYQGSTYSNFTTEARAEAGISFANASVDAQLTSGYTGQALTNANELTVTYSSSDETVATINSSTGAITELRKAGSTTINATFAGNATYKPAVASYTLNVTEKTPAGLNYALTEVEKSFGDENFTNTLSNPNSLVGVTYASSDTDVATVDEDGEVTIKAVGETTITATFAGNESYNAGNASYTLTVNKATPTLSFAFANITGHIGEAVSANALTNPAGLSVSYSSSDGTVATVNTTSGVVANPLKAGTTTITASFAGNDNYVAGNASYTLKVLANPTISIDDDDVDFGKTYTFDDSALSSYGAVTLTSGNENIATVSGLVITPVACGTVTITVNTAENEDYRDGSATFDLTINAPVGATTSDELITTLDFTDNSGWRMPTDYTTTTDTYTSGGYSVTLAGEYKFSSTYTMLKSGSTLTFSAFDKKVTKIKVVGNSGASTKTKENIYVDNTAVSTETTGSTGTNTFEINSNYQTIGTTYKLQVSTANAQITSIEVYTTPAAPTVTLNASGYATYCSEYPLDFSDYATADYSAWQITELSTTDGKINGEIIFSQITGSVKGGTGILLKGTAGETISLTSLDSDTELSGNKLIGTTAPTYVTTTIGDNTFFGLSGNSFKKINSGTIPANKAYLPILTSSIPNGVGIKSFTFIFDTATGVRTVEKISAAEAEAIFNLAGQRIQKPQRGINIVNGRKVLVK